MPSRLLLLLFSCFSLPCWRVSAVTLKVGARAWAVAGVLRNLAPYAVIELLLPGGSLMALLLWLYRRQKKASIFATHEILALL